MSKTAATSNPATSPGAAPHPDFGALIDRWFADHFHGSAVARSSEAINVALRARDDLKHRLAAALAPAPQPAADSDQPA